MRYYQLMPISPRTESGNLWIIQFPPEIDQRLFVHGQIEDWNPSLIGTYPDEPLTPDFSLAINGWPIFSPKSRNLIADRWQGMIQFLPFKLQRADGEGEISDFTIGHVLNRATCIDRSRTKVRKDDWTPRRNGTFDIIGPISLLQTAVANYPIFRVAEYPVHVIVREDVKQAMEVGKITGSKFAEVQVSED